MATWNGARWISEQVQSIFSQRNCTVHLIVSDDNSSDDTLPILEKLAFEGRLFVMPTAKERFGTANRNFINLILFANLDNCDYVALSDQDDIWFENKLEQAIACIEANALDGYSSNVVAFWENGRNVLLNKSGKQKSLDYLFESAGPGCTFVMKKTKFLELRVWTQENLAILRQFVVHDWFVYAYARSRGWKWHIDERPSMRYRQHSSNEIGANVGFGAAKARFIKFIKTDYLMNSLTIGELVSRDTSVVDALKRFSFFDMVYLVCHANEYRRRISEVWALRFLIVFYWFLKRVKHDGKT